MKKLISIFAAMALVGSIAAAPKKPAAKPAPAKPVVAAPSVATAVAAAPAVANAGKGIGLFIEGRGLYALANGTSASQLDGDTSGTSRTAKLSNSAGFGGGATIGYDLVNNLSLVASFDYRAIKSREWAQAAATSNTTIQNKSDTMVLGIGLRPRVVVGPGHFYAGAGFAYVLPFKDTTTQKTVLTSGTTFTDQTTVQNWNAGIGAYGELGYNFQITDNLYFGLGARLLVATANNDGKTTEVTNNLTSTTTTQNNAASFDTTDLTKAKYASQGITDIAAVINVGVRF
jgi:hypothetical protein